MYKKLQFLPPVTILKNGAEVPLHDVDQALSYLRSIPDRARDEKWVCAVRCCEFARDGLMGVDSARRSIEIWASEGVSVNARARVNVGGAQNQAAII